MGRTCLRTQPGSELCRVGAQRALGPLKSSEGGPAPALLPAGGGGQAGELTGLSDLGDLLVPGSYVLSYPRCRLSQEMGQPLGAQEFYSHTGLVTRIFSPQSPMVYPGALPGCSLVPGLWMRLLKGQGDSTGVGVLALGVRAIWPQLVTHGSPGSVWLVWLPKQVLSLPRCSCVSLYSLRETDCAQPGACR